jgi:hypothetical protein
MLGGAAEGSGSDEGAGDPLMDLLGGMMGGGAAGGEGGGQQGAGDMAGMLGGLLGGGGQQGAGGMAGMLGALLGGGSAGTGIGSFLDPIVSGLAEKLGLPPEIAQAVVAFALEKLLSGQLGAGDRGAAAPAGQEGLELDDVLTRMGSGEPVDADYLASTGMAEELSEQTGLDPDTAAASLEEAFSMLGSGMGGASPSGGQDAPDLSGLDDILASF